MRRGAGAVPKILIYDSVSQAGLDLLAPRKDIAAVAAGTRDVMLKEIVDADAIVLRYLPLDREAIEGAKRLRVVARHGVGYDNVDLAALNARRIPLATIGEANSVTVAELTLYLMLAACKQGLAYDQAVRGGRFAAREDTDAIELYRKKALVIGFGRIGGRVAPRCRAFEMEVYVCDPYLPQDAIRDQGFTPVMEFREVLPEMDVVTLHVPLTDETRHLIDAEALALMKKGAVLVNTARGPIVDGAAAAKALDAGRLFAAGFDVFESEPPALDDALVQCPRTVLTPHMGALTEECHRRSAVRSMQHALDAIDGCLDPAYVVNPEILP